MPEKKPAAGFDFESARTEPDQLAALLERAIASRARDVARWGEHLFRIDPNTARRYALYARALASEGKFSQAEEIFERYEKMYGDDAESLYARAQVSLLRNLTGRAEELLTRAL